jgi:GMP synthase (glutamine-hydrolysing)
MILVLDNSIDPDYACLTDEIARHFGDATVVSLPDGDPVPEIDGRVDAAVLTGSSAGVYERADRPWIDREARAVRSLVDRRVPTLGICFGHQLVNAALGGRVEHRSLTAGLVRASLDDAALFDGVGPIVPALHGDHVVERGARMQRIGSADHCPNFATRHRSAPVWTVQYHPELTERIARERVEPDVGWDAAPHSHADSTARRTLANFRRLAVTPER